MACQKALPSASQMQCSVLFLSAQRKEHKSVFDQQCNSAGKHCCGGVDSWMGLAGECLHLVVRPKCRLWRSL